MTHIRALVFFGFSGLAFANATLTTFHDRRRYTQSPPAFGLLGQIDKWTSRPFEFLQLRVLSNMLWRLKDIEGMSRSEIVERAIIRLARRRGIEHP
jgi:hypothetical protein